MVLITVLTRPVQLDLNLPLGSAILKKYCSYGLVIGPLDKVQIVSSDLRMLGLDPYER